jgi:hypothetical protein
MSSVHTFAAVAGFRDLPISANALMTEGEEGYAD